MVVAAVDPNSDAGAKGLARGAVIIGANGRDVASQADLAAAIAEAKSQGRAAMLLRVIVRGQQAVSVPIRLR